jgi:hypothetical protein
MHIGVCPPELVAAEVTGDPVGYSRQDSSSGGSSSSFISDAL